jgi:predicted CopG family antitoxin
MNLKTIKIDEQTWKLLTLIKSQKNLSSMDDVLKYLIKKGGINIEAVLDLFTKIDQL